MCAICTLIGLLSSCVRSVIQTIRTVQTLHAWVRVPPRAAPFSKKKKLSWMVLLCLLCTCLASLDSCVLCMYIHVRMHHLTLIQVTLYVSTASSRVQCVCVSAFVCV